MSMSSIVLPLYIFGAKFKLPFQCFPVRKALYEFVRRLMQ